MSHVSPSTPLKLADYYKIHGVFNLNSIPFTPGDEGNAVVLRPSVMVGEYRSFVELVLQNDEASIQSWHFDGYSFFVVASTLKDTQLS